MIDINISDIHNCIFIHIPKNAGTSVKEALGLGRKVVHLPWHYYLVGHHTKWKSYLKFAVVRNPWDRIISSYSFAKMEYSYYHTSQRLHPDHLLLRDKTFAECCTILRDEKNLLKNPSWAPQHSWISDMEDRKTMLMVDRILRYEHLEDDFSGLCKELGIEHRNLPRINTSDHTDFRQFYNEEIKEIVRNFYAEDIRLFHYAFECKFLSAVRNPLSVQGVYLRP